MACVAVTTGVVDDGWSAERVRVPGLGHRWRAARPQRVVCRVGPWGAMLTCVSSEKDVVGCSQPSA